MPVKFWFDRKKAEKTIRDAVSARMEQARSVGIETATRLVPVDTGQTRDSIGGYFDPTTLILTLYAGTSYASFLEYGTEFETEFGTHTRPARPFMRPALIAAGNVLAGTGGAVRIKFEGGDNG